MGPCGRGTAEKLPLSTEARSALLAAEAGLPVWPAPGEVQLPAHPHVGVQAGTGPGPGTPLSV